MKSKLAQKLLAGILSVAMVLNMGITTVFAVTEEALPDDTSSVCTHHVHDENCGYAEGAPCTFDPATCESCNTDDSGIIANTITTFAPLARSEYTLPIGADGATIANVLVFPKTIKATVNKAEIDLSVTWESDKAISNEKADTFTYTAKLTENGNQNHTLADGVAMPQIAVMVVDEVRTMAGDGWQYPASATGIVWTGEGTSQSPYLIKTAQDLANLSYMVNTNSKEDAIYYRNTYFKLDNNIDLNEGFVFDANGVSSGSGSPKEWISIGTLNGSIGEISPFGGIFDGSGYTIHGLYVNDTTSQTRNGLFGSTGSATIKNLNLENAYINCNNTCVGGLVGLTFGGDIIENCTVNAYINRTSGAGAVNGVGGIVGSTYGCNCEVRSCEFNGQITVGKLGIESGYAAPYIGGIVGDNNGYIADCINKGSVESNSQDKVGGIAGANNVPYGNAQNVISEKTGVIERCVNAGNVKGSHSTGGIAGYSESWGTRIENTGIIRNCLNLGSVTDIAKSPMSGGIIGYCNSTDVKNCYNNAQITGTDGSIGGIVGKQFSDQVSDCYFLQSDSINSGLTVVGARHDDTVAEPISSKPMPQIQASSGEVSYLLNGSSGSSTPMWYQTIGTDTYPVLDSTHKVVYQYTNVDGTKYYSNGSPNQITAVAGKTSKVYDATPFTVSTVNGNNFSWNGIGTAAIEGYYTKEGSTYTETTVEGSGATGVGGAPVKVGTYYVKLNVSADNDYLAVTDYMPITINESYAVYDGTKFYRATAENPTTATAEEILSTDKNTINNLHATGASPLMGSCTNLKTVTCADTVTEIDKRAFDGCTSLASVAMPNVTTIVNTAFNACTSLSTVTMPNVTSIGENAFTGCTSLATVEMSKVTTIGNAAFSRCTALTEAQLPNVTNIGDGAFSDCAKLESVELQSATSIGTRAFFNCKALKSVEMPKATSIGENAFGYCEGLTSVAMPKVTTIGDKAFNACTKLESVKMPKATTIGNFAFNGCTALASLTLGATPPTTVGTNAFKDCPTPRTLIIQGNPAFQTEVLAAYKAVDDGTTDELSWYGWTLPTTLDGKNVAPSAGTLTATGNTTTIFGTDNAITLTATFDKTAKAGKQRALTINQVEFKDGETVPGTIATATQNADGKWVATLDVNTKDWAVGTHNLTATFAGNHELSGITSNTMTVTVGKSATTFDGGVKAYNGNTEATTFAYGDTITVKATPKATGTAAARSLTPPAANQMALFVGDTQITEPQAVTSGTELTFTIATVSAIKDKQLVFGDNSITAKYVGNDNMADYSEDVKVTLNKKAIASATVKSDDSSATKVYDGTNSFKDVALTLKAEDILSGETVTATANGTTEDKNAGATKAFTATAVTLSGAQADYYSLATSAVSGAVAITAIVPTVNTQARRVYANGTPITIEAGTGTTTKIKYYDGTNDVYLKLSGELTEADLSNYVIYGGKEADLVDSTSITMTGGTVKFVYGGGYTGAVSGSTSVTMTGGTVNTVYGGGYTGAVSGSTSVTISGGTVDVDVYGGGKGTVTGDTAVTINGSANVKGSVYGGGASGAVSGSTSVTMTDGTVGYTVYGGGDQAAATVGSTTVTISGGTVDGSVCGGGSTGKVSGSTAVTISGGTVTNVYGGGLEAEATVGSTKVEISGSANVTGSVFGGGASGAVEQGTAVTVSGGTVGKSVYGGADATATVSSTKVNISGNAAVTGSVYGGGNNGTVTGDTAVTISANVTGSVFGGGASGTVTGGTAVTISGGTVGENVFGGGASGTVTGGTAVTISGGTVSQNVYGGGSTGKVSGSTAVTISDSANVTGNVYGGGTVGTVDGTKTGYVALAGKTATDTFDNLLHKDTATNWTVKGSCTLAENVILAANETLTIPNDATLTVPSGKTLTANGTLTATGNGKLVNNGGTLNITVFQADDIQGISDKVYTGNVIAFAPTVAANRTILGNTFTIDASGYTSKYQKQNADNRWADVTEIKDVGKYKIVYMKKSTTAEKSFAITKSGTTFDGGITVDKTDKTYTYGDTITVTAKPKATGVAARSITPPTANQMALFMGGTQISQAVDGINGVYTMTYDTADKDLIIGSNTITAEYVGDNKMADYSEDVTVTLNKKAIASASVKAGATKVYDGNTSFTIVALTPNSSDILSGDAVTATAKGTAADANVGATKVFTATAVTLSEARADYYTLATSAVGGNVAITAATPTVAVTAEKKKVSSFSIGNHDDTIILKATVTGVTGGTVPTGTITFKSGTTTVASAVKVTNGVATYEWVNPDAANHTITAEFAATADTNYGNATGTSTAFDIDKTEQKALNITNVPNKVTYGDKAFTLSTKGGSGTGGVTYAVTAGDAVSVVESTGEVTALKVGTATITATKAGDNNYNATTATTTITVKAAAPTVTWGTTEQSTTYTGSPVLASVLTAPNVTLVKGETFGGTIQYAYKYVGGLTKGLFADYTDGLPTNAGKYEIKAKIAANGNYTEAESTNTMTLTINRSTPILKVNTMNGKAYDGTVVANPTASDMSLTGASYADVTFAYSKKSNMSSPLATAPKNAGTYYVQASVAKGDNTNAASSTAVSFTITKAALTVIGGTVTPKTWDNTTAAAVTALTFSGLASGEKLDITKDYTVGSPVYNDANAGTDKTVTGKAALVSNTKTDNYTLTEAYSITNQTISAKPLTEATVTVGGDYTYTGAEITPTAANVTVKDGTTTLVKGTDYDYAASDNINAGTAKITITGKGNYTDTATKTFTITAKSTTPTIGEITNQTYTGSAIEPVLVVTDGKTTLVKDTDYTVAYKDNINAGKDTAKAIVTLMGNYKGTATKTFTITKKAVTDAMIGGIANHIYTGKAIEPTLTVTDGDALLRLDTDYTVAYTDNINVGTATATITGKGNYKGTAAQTFTITKDATKLTNAMITPIDDQTYTGEAIKPVVVTDGDALLRLDTDYTVTYKDNINVGTATATVSGKGNYTGTIEKTFTIVKADGTQVKDYAVPTARKAITNVSPKLSNVTLDGKGDGVWSWSADKDLTADNKNKVQTFKATFTPTDSKNYNTVEVDVQVSVSKLSIAIEGTKLRTLTKGAKETLTSLVTVVGAELKEGTDYNTKLTVSKENIVSVSGNEITANNVGTVKVATDVMLGEIKAASDYIVAEVKSTDAGEQSNNTADEIKDLTDDVLNEKNPPKELVDAVADATIKMDPKEKEKLDDETVKKLDELFETANSKLEVLAPKIEHKDGVENGISGVDAAGVALAAGLTSDEIEKGNTVQIKVEQEPPAKVAEGKKAQMQLKLTLLVNGKKATLDSPLVIDIQLDKNMKTDGLEIAHEHDDGTIDILTEGTKLTAKNFIINQQTKVLTMRVTSFSTFTFTTAAEKPIDPTPSKPVDPTPSKPVDPTPSKPESGATSSTASGTTSSSTSGATSTKPSTPSTGDSSPLGAMAGVIILSLAGMVGLVWKKKNR